MLAEDKPKIRERQPNGEPPIVPIGCSPVITWDKLPDDFILPDDPVDTLQRPFIAAAITEALMDKNLVPINALTFTNYGIIATVDGTIIAQAPDWGYVANITATIKEVNRSYTPHLQGEVPTIVLEFLSDTDRTEYSMKPSNSMGKWYFYERILKVPYYGIFDPTNGNFQVYILGESGSYEPLTMDESGRYWIEPMQLSIASWQGKYQYLTGWWLRWWDADRNILPWTIETLEQLQQQIIQQERAQAEGTQSAYNPKSQI